LGAVAVFALDKLNDHALRSENALKQHLEVASLSTGEVGVVKPFVVSERIKPMPKHDGWLALNGQSTAGYPELAAIMGPNLPDYLSPPKDGRNVVFYIRAKPSAN